MTYVDGFLAPVLPGRTEDYRRMCAEAGRLFVEHGALHVVEALGDDLPHGKVTDFYRAVQAEEGEGIVFSWIVWPSRQARDAGWKAVMADERMKRLEDMPFDGRRIFSGGFDIIFDSKVAA